MAQTDRPLVPGHVFWNCIWPKLEALGWKSGLARDLEVGCRVYKPGRKANRKTARRGEDFFLYNDLDNALIDHALEQGLVAAEDIWPPPPSGAGSQGQTFTEAEVEEMLDAGEAASKSPPLTKKKRQGRDATPKKTQTPRTPKQKKKKRKATPLKKATAEKAGVTMLTRQMTGKKKLRGSKEEKVLPVRAQEAAQPEQKVENADVAVAGASSTSSSSGDVKTNRLVDSGTQLLMDVELHMLQFVATVIRHRRVLCGIDTGGAMDGAAELVADIEASQQDLTYEVEQLIGYLLAPAALDAGNTQRLVAPRFHPTSREKLGFLGEINVHAMQFVASVRRRRRSFSPGRNDQSQYVAAHALEEWNARAQSIVDLQNDLTNELIELTVGPPQKGPHEMKTPMPDGDMTETDEEYAWLATEEMTEEEEDEEWKPTAQTPRGRKLKPRNLDVK